MFEFHDSVFKLDCVTKDSIRVWVSALNISRDAKQNPKGYDLEIEKACITFDGVSDLTYDIGRNWTTDEDGNYIPVTPEIIYGGEEAMKKITDELREGFEVYSHTIVDGDGFAIEGAGIEPWFEIRFKARRFTVEWDRYLAPAWYEAMKRYKK